MLILMQITGPIISYKTDFNNDWLSSGETKFNNHAHISWKDGSNGVHTLDTYATF